jgi:hypothetical protein
MPFARSGRHASSAADLIARVDGGIDVSALFGWRTLTEQHRRYAIEAGRAQ